MSILKIHKMYDEYYSDLFFVFNVLLSVITQSQTLKIYFFLQRTPTIQTYNEL